jgi:HNH endonuclease
MPAQPLPIPNCCVWCRKRSPDVGFDESHVLPECVGNQQQVLPSGIVCKPCNQYFGAKIEPVLLADPIFPIVAVFLQVVDPGDMNLFRERLFDPTHPPVGKIKRDLNLNTNIEEQTIRIDFSNIVSGRLEKTYQQRDLAFLSRAVHKIAFESFVWQVFVGGNENPPDVFSDLFNPVRDWARFGKPHGSVRPVVRRPHKVISTTWTAETWSFSQDFAVQLNLFFDWYAVSLTSPKNSVMLDLSRWIQPKSDDMWVIAEKMTPLGPSAKKP